MRYLVLITEMNIDDAAHPEAFRYTIEADTEADAAAKGRERFTEQLGRGPAARAIVDVESLE
jgi:Xaa-Pro aminopeptidase